MCVQQCAGKLVRKVNLRFIQVIGNAKLKLSISVNQVHGEWRYFRSCAFMGEPGIHGDERFCLMRTGTFNIFMEYCQCNSKDGCNAAGLNVPSHSWLYAVAIATVVAVGSRRFIL